MAEAYKDRLATLIQDVRNEMTGRRDLPIILEVDEQHPWVVQRPIVITAQKMLAKQDPSIDYTTMIGLEKADSTHLNAIGLEKHGKRILDAYRKLMSKKNRK